MEGNIITGLDGDSIEMAVWESLTQKEKDEWLALDKENSK